MVVNMAALDEVVRSRVIDRFDHANLNLDPLFVNRVPTTENLCRAVFELLKDALPAGEAGASARGRDGEQFFECEGE
jgi:6-pyruvoyltetrahydropterin/6-carboxytetrahydropterin synthase